MDKTGALLKQLGTAKANPLKVQEAVKVKPLALSAEDKMFIRANKPSNNFTAEELINITPVGSVSNGEDNSPLILPNTSGTREKSASRQVWLRGMTTAERAAMTVTNGTIVYDTTLNQFWGYSGSAWSQLGSGSGNTIQALGDLGAAETIQFDNGGFVTGTLDQNCNITLSDPATATRAYRVYLQLSQPAAGGKTVVWAGNLFWPGSTEPTLSATNNAVDLFEFAWNGSKWCLVNAIFDMQA